jgi:hypothetical protein
MECKIDTTPQSPATPSPPSASPMLFFASVLCFLVLFLGFVYCLLALLKTDMLDFRSELDTSWLILRSLSFFHLILVKIEIYFDVYVLAKVRSYVSS